MEFGILLISSLPRYRGIDRGVGNTSFFCQAMRDDRCDSPVKEIKNSIIDMLKGDAQFVYAVAKEVGFWAAQLMPQF
jgi:hypothetical protein